jgi:beta-lactamase regulating signal transducer with metallopeptidase domain
MNDPAYPANFAVQAILLSAFTLVIVACLRRPERRAGAALVGMLACGVIPFVSAFAPVKERVSPGRVIRMEAQPLPPLETMIPINFPEPVAGSGERLESVLPPPAKLDPVFWILRVWMVGILAGALLMIGELLRTRCWLRTLVAPDEREWDLIRDVAPEGFCRDQIRISADASGPCVIGFWRPRIVVPRWLLESRHHRELDWTLRHELEHLRCHDSRWIHVIRAIRIVQWWNPLLHRLIGVWSQAREQACDLQAIRDADEGPDYGHFLLKVAGGKPSRFAAAMAVTRETKRLRRRISGLLKSPVPRPAPVSAGWQLAMGGLMVGIAFFTSAFGFARAPQAAGAAAEDDMSWLEPKPIVHVRAMAVIAPEPFATQGEVLTNEELEKRLARDVRKKGFHFQILPTESMQQGSMLTVHLTVIRDSSITDPPWDGSRTIDPFVGWVVHYEPQVAGEGVRLGVRAAYAFPPGTHPAPGFVLRTAPPRPFGTFSGNSSDPVGLAGGRSWDDVTMVTANESALVRSGQILCTTLGEIEKGVHALCLTGVITRMPWDHSSMLEFPALEPPVPERKIGVKVVTTKQSIELTAEQQALSKRIGELRRELSKKVDTNPVNELLLKLRMESETELAGEDAAKDKEKAAHLQWRIQRITDRMQERCGGDYEVDRLEIMRLDEELHRGLLKRITERRAKPDPSKFNNNEQ